MARQYFKEWREYRHLSQVRAASRVGLDQGTLSKIERGVRRYNQDLLEAMAHAYRCEPADLLMRNPLDRNAVWSITDQLLKADPITQDRAIRIVKELLKKTG